MFLRRNDSASKLYQRKAEIVKICVLTSIKNFKKLSSFSIRTVKKLICKCYLAMFDVEIIIFQQLILETDKSIKFNSFQTKLHNKFPCEI